MNLLKWAVSVAVVLMLSLTASAQKLIDKAAYLHFFSSAPIEDIEAVNEHGLGALDLSNGKVAVTMNMSQFEFEKSLMKEHFNENYIESDKFPKATFTGSLIDFDERELRKIKDSVSFDVSGQMTIHGVTRSLETEVWFKRKGKSLIADTKFIVEVASFDIDIPTVVIMNIAEQVEVTAKFEFNQ